MPDAQPQAESRLGWMLKRLTEEIPGARSAVLLAADGIKTAAHGLSNDDADRTAAMAANLLSTARAAGRTLGGTEQARAEPVVRQVLIDLVEFCLLVSVAGEGSALALVTDDRADLRTAAHLMGQFVSSLQQHLGTAARGAVPASQGAAGTP